MRLLVFMNFVSLDLQTHNLNLNRMWFIKALLFSINESLLAESKIPKITVYCVKAGNIKVF